jgi:methyltransferase
LNRQGAKNAKMFYIYFLVFNVLEMLGEYWISARNSRTLLQKGAVEIAPFLLPVMATLYGVMYFGGLAEHLFFRREVSPAWAISFGVLFCLAKALKFWAIASLGSFWTMRVLILPKSSVVTAGPYRWIRHPNYVAVLMEIAATTLIGKCFYTFAVVIILFSVTLVSRIQYEERALKEYTDYSDQMGVRHRFLP